jgi:hypothetical protein
VEFDFELAALGPEIVVASAACLILLVDLALRGRSRAFGGIETLIGFRIRCQAQHHSRLRGETMGEAVQPAGFHDAVRVGHGDPVSARAFKPRAQRVFLRADSGWHISNPDPFNTVGMERGEPVQDPGGTVSGAVVGHDDLHPIGRVILRQKGVEGFGKIRFFVARGDQNRHERLRRRRITALRRAGKTGEAPDQAQVKQKVEENEEKECGDKPECGIARHGSTLGGTAAVFVNTQTFVNGVDDDPGVCAVAIAPEFLKKQGRVDDRSGVGQQFVARKFSEYELSGVTIPGALVARHSVPAIEFDVGE